MRPSLTGELCPGWFKRFWLSGRGGKSFSNERAEFGDHSGSWTDSTSEYDDPAIAIHRLSAQKHVKLFAISDVAMIFTP